MYQGLSAPEPIILGTVAIMVGVIVLIVRVIVRAIRK
jgi:hypothetical protein